MFGCLGLCTFNLPYILNMLPWKSLLPLEKIVASFWMMISTLTVKKMGVKLKPSLNLIIFNPKKTGPRKSKKWSPENQWLVQMYILKWSLFRGHVNFHGCTTIFQHQPVQHPTWRMGSQFISAVTKVSSCFLRIGLFSPLPNGLNGL